ncbi:acyltransferase family protein [Acidocella facilis]|uniref:acyltransferase family protein n=1 Tax=Acidocella facilis TaxID=525 RepID=UPI001F39078D|nr:acyltransferase [Acidocella facilis]
MQRAANRFLTLEIARFIAAFCVATDHLAGLATRNGTGGMPDHISLPPFAAVLFFFVLSGFVIQNAHARDYGQPAALPRYLWRRIWRIYPLYWLSLIMPLWFLWHGSSLTYLSQIISLAPITPFSMPEANPPAWSLRFEVAFYLVFALTLIPRIGRWVLGLWLAALLLVWFPHPFDAVTKSYFHELPPGFAWYFFGLHNLLFLCGMGAATLLIRHRLPPACLWALLATCVLAILPLLAQQNWGFTAPGRIVEGFTGLAFAGLVLALAGLEQSHRLTPPRWGAGLGTMSYPLYLIHADCGALVIKTLQAAGLAHLLPVPELFLLEMALSLTAAALLAFLIDKPLQRLARRVV